jgi:hypothetical protein
MITSVSPPFVAGAVVVAAGLAAVESFFAGAVDLVVVDFWAAGVEDAC